MNSNQHVVLVTNRGELISTNFNATPKEIQHAKERNYREDPTEYLMVPTGEEYNETLTTEIISRTHSIMKRFGNKMGMPLYDVNFESALKVAITHVLINQ